MFCARSRPTNKGNREQKPITKKLAEFHNQFVLLTMLRITSPPVRLSICKTRSPRPEQSEEALISCWATNVFLKQLEMNCLNFVNGLITPLNSHFCSSSTHQFNYQSHHSLWDEYVFRFYCSAHLIIHSFAINNRDTWLQIRTDEDPLGRKIYPFSLYVQFTSVFIAQYYYMYNFAQTLS